jgi:hypothetical protein
MVLISDHSIESKFETISYENAIMSLTFPDMKVCLTGPKGTAQHHSTTILR